MFCYQCEQTAGGTGCTKVSVCGKDEDICQMLKAVTTAKLKPVIDSVTSLERVTEAMSKMETAKRFGKIMLKVHQ